ncbi:MAG: class I SAM-dependent methyltransferase [Oligoflexia bacterium]|nr:class I SAM-dependent methyltransferase [Oligoflexia bacterium]
MSLKEKIKNFYFKQQFQPNVLGIFLNPFFIARYALYKEMQSFSTQLNGKVLDIGCGSKPYENLFKVSKYIGLELDSDRNRQNTKADFFYDGKSFPFKENEFDFIICNQVLEHVFEPNLFLQEVRRVLKPTGKALFTIPFLWDEHEQPIDYARYSSFGIKHLVEKNGFHVTDLKKLNPGLSAIWQLKIGFIYKKILKLKYSKLIVLISALLFSVHNLLYYLFLVKKNRQADLYLDNLIFVEKRS